MSIISILLLLVTPSIGLLSSQRLTSAGNQMADITLMARQNSIAKNVFTAIVIKTQGIGAYSTYCLLDLTQNDDGSYGSWQAATPWRDLTEGIIFSPSTSSSTICDFLAGTTNTPIPLPTQFPFRGTQINLTPGNSASQTIVQIYQPNGIPLNAARSLRIRLSEGTVAQDNHIIYTHPTQDSGGIEAPENYYDIVIVRDTGQTEIERR